MTKSPKEQLREDISKVFIKHHMPTRQVAISDIMALIDQYVAGIIGEDEPEVNIESSKAGTKYTYLVAASTNNQLRAEQRKRASL